MKILIAIVACMLLCSIWACNKEDEGTQYDDHGVDIAPAINFQIDENPLNGALIGRIPEVLGSNNSQFSLQNSDPFGALELDATTGELFVRDSTFFNFELNPSIITTSIASAGNTSVQRPVHISVRDIYEEFSYIGDINIRWQDDLDEFVAGNHWAVSGTLRLEANGVLDLSGLETLERVGSLVLNGSFTGTEGLRNIRRIENTLHIANNNAWTDLSPLNLNVDYLGGNLRITRINNITTLAGLGLNFDELLGGLYLTENESLTRLDGLGFHSIHGSLVINSNPALESLLGLEATFIGENLAGSGNSELLNFTGSNIQHIGGEIRFFRNTALTSLDGLSVTSLHNIELSHNFSLTDISALEQLESVEKDIIIINSYYLTDYCALSNCIQSGGLGGDFQIKGNWYNPTLQQMLDGECSI